MPGLTDILDRVCEVWKTDRNALIESGDKMTELLNKPQTAGLNADAEKIPAGAVENAFINLSSNFDSENGGFGTAPKFPSPHTLLFLLRYFYVSKNKHALQMAELTLDAINRGGIHDHIGFGFCRYSTDIIWLVPHFEKMLYDNALLAMAYLEAFQASGNKEYARTAEKIFTYILRDMTDKEGGFYSAEDADSEGSEGKFYIWTKKEILEVLGNDDGGIFCRYYDITDRGNFKEGGLRQNIPNLIKGDIPVSDKSMIEECRQKLFNHRKKRVRPGMDDKILTGWNSLMIAAMAMGGRILGRKEYTAAAEKAAAFILTRLVREDGRLLARCREGEAAVPAYSDDYAFLVWGLIELYETTYRPVYLAKALSLTSEMTDLFEDKEGGGFFMTGRDSEKLISRPKVFYDAAVPSANSAAAMNMIRLSELTGRQELKEEASKLFSAIGGVIKKSPESFSFSLAAALFSQSPAMSIII